MLGALTLTCDTPPLSEDRVTSEVENDALSYAEKESIGPQQSGRMGSAAGPRQMPYEKS